MKTIAQTMTTATSRTHYVALIINSFLLRREGPRECEWDNFLMVLLCKVNGNPVLGESATQRLRSQLEKLRGRFMEKDSLLQGVSFIDTGSNWINNGCPEPVAEI